MLFLLSDGSYGSESPLIQQIRPSGLLLLLGLDALHLLRAAVLDGDRRACFQAGEGQCLILAFAGLALPTGGIIGALGESDGYCVAVGVT